MIQRAIIVARGEKIRCEDLPLNIRAENVANISDYQASGSFELQLRDYKIRLAVAAVRDNNGNKTLAARQPADLTRLSSPAHPIGRTRWILRRGYCRG